MKRNILHSWPYGIVILVWLLFSFPYIARGLVPFPADYLVSFFSPWSASYAMPVKNNAMPDVITQIYPWKILTVESWKQGEVPLWNPYSFSGTVHAGNYQSAVFSPFTLFFFFLPFIDAWSIIVLLQPLLAGVFMLLFLQTLGCSRKASALGAIGFMFSGFVVTWMAYATLAYALVFLPLICWSILRYMNKPSFWVFIIGSFAVASSFLSGHFQISVYVLAVSVAYALYSTVSQKTWKRGVGVCFMLGIGLLLAAPQILLTYDAFQKSVRSVNTQMKEVIPWRYLITYIAPDFYGNPVTRNDWFGHYAEWAGYIGIVPLIAAFYGICFSGKKQKGFFIAIGAVGLLLAYASPLSWLIFATKVPVLSTSAASRVISIASFSLCILSAFGLDQLVSDWKSGVRRKTLWFIGGIGAVVVFLWTVAYVPNIYPIEYVNVARRNMLLPTLIIGTVIAAILGGFWKKSRYCTVICFAMLAVACFDGYRYASKWMPFASRAYVYPELSSLSFLQDRIGIDRAYGNIGNEVASPFHIPLIEGYDAMYQGRYGEFIGASSNGIVTTPERSVVNFDKHGRYALDTLRLLGVKYIVHRISDGRNIWAFPFWQYPEEFTSLYRDEHIELLEFTHALPRVFLASSCIVVQDPQEIIDTLYGQEFDPRQTLILEKDTPEGSPQEGEGVIENIVYSMTKATMTVKTSVPKLLFRSDVFDSGWHATIDTVPVPIYRADYDFQAIFVPAGTHMVEFFYQPASYTYGCYILAAGCVMLFVAAGLHAVRRAKKKKL